MILPVDPEIYQNDELKHWGILGMKWGIRHFKNEFTHSEEFLSHYRTPGSKNGVRLYQYPDGTLTELGKLHYYGNNLMGKTPKSARGQYYDPKHKPGTFDFYGKEQKQNLKEFVQNNGGQKRYKGYERSEMHDIHEPAYDWNYKNHRKELRKNVERSTECEKLFLHSLQILLFHNKTLIMARIFY